MSEICNYEIIINPAKTCAFTGHRTVYQDFDVNKLKKAVEQVIEYGFDTFLVGMAVGADTEFFKLLLDYKKKHEIKIIACIPCKNQSAKFSEKQKKEYFYLLDKADGKIVLQEEYTPYCMKKRNEFMVKNSSVLIAYLRRDYGGTKQTVLLAQRYLKKIIFV